MVNAPKDASQRLKYLEKRIVMSEHSLVELSQQLGLYRVEKVKAVEELAKKTDTLLLMKHEFTQKAEFLY